MDYQETILENVSKEVKVLLSDASEDFKKEWDGCIYFPTDEKNDLVGPALNENALDLLDDEHRRKLKEIKEKYFG